MRFDGRHPLANVARRQCRSQEKHHWPGHTKVACSACWEAAIRADERAVVEFGLTPEVPTADLADEVAIERAVKGEAGTQRLTPSERFEAALQLMLDDREIKPSEICRRLRISWPTWTQMKPLLEAALSRELVSS